VYRCTVIGNYRIFCYGHGEEACTTVVQRELYLGFLLAAAAFARFVKLSISQWLPYTCVQKSL
jgi:hypothetical protein